MSSGQPAAMAEGCPGTTDSTALIQRVMYCREVCRGAAHEPLPDAACSPRPHKTHDED